MGVLSVTGVVLSISCDSIEQPGQWNQVAALPHEKCYRKDVMPQIENVTQIKRGL